MQKRQQQEEKIRQARKIDVELDEAFELGNAASAGDCTGTVVSAPKTEEEQQAYEKVYHYQPQTCHKKNQK